MKATARKNIQAKLLRVLASEKSAGSIDSACRKVGVSRQSVYNWRKQDERFDNDLICAVSNGKSILADLAEQALVQKIKEGNMTAIIFTLKNLRRDYYGDKEEKRTEQFVSVTLEPNMLGLGMN